MTGPGFPGGTIMATGKDETGRPLKRALAYLAGLGAFFYASYGFANWVSGLRGDVPSIVFAWERAVPFLGWTILPYWTTNVFYAGSLIFSRNRLELDVQARRLLTAQVIAIACFLLFPLKFSWPKPDTTGLFGFMFEALGAFDKPFNQAPSLHVALTTILIAQYRKLLPPLAFAVFLGWSVLVIASVMTTFQHHFIDIPTGALLGLACLWLWRDDGSHALGSARITRDPRRRRLAAFYALGALAAAGLALARGDVWLWLFWPAVSMLLVALAYAALGTAVFQKARNGRIAWPAWLLLAPYLAAAWINSRLWTRSAPAPVEIEAGLWLGRFPGEDDVKRFSQVVDLTAEFSAPRAGADWHAFPMLDLVAPGPSRLRHAALAIDAARGHGDVLVCCALGYGRSVAALATWLVLTGRASSIDDAIDRLRKARPRLALHSSQHAAIEEAIRRG